MTDDQSKDGPGLLTGPEAAARLRICERTLRKLRQCGEIGYIAITDKRFLYAPEDCEAYIASRRRVDVPQVGTRCTARRISSVAGGVGRTGGDFMAQRAARKAEAAKKRGK